MPTTCDEQLIKAKIDELSYDVVKSKLSKLKGSFIYFFNLQQAGTAKTNSVYNIQWVDNTATQPAITCSKLTIKTLEKGMKYVQS